MTTIYRPPAQTPAGMVIADLVSDILAHTEDLEERLVTAITDPRTSDLRSKIKDRIDVLNSRRHLAAALGRQDEIDECHLLIEELRGLLRENGE